MSAELVQWNHYRVSAACSALDVASGLPDLERVDPKARHVAGTAAGREINMAQLPVTTLGAGVMSARRRRRSGCASTGNVTGRSMVLVQPLHGASVSRKRTATGRRPATATTSRTVRAAPSMSGMAGCARSANARSRVIMTRRIGWRLPSTISCPVRRSWFRTTRRKTCGWCTMCAIPTAATRIVQTLSSRR